MRRPDVFTLDYSHPLAQGLVFAGLGADGAFLGLRDSSLLNNHGAGLGYPISAFPFFDTLQRRCVNGTFSGSSIAGPLLSLSAFTLSSYIISSTGPSWNYSRIFTMYSADTSENNIALGSSSDSTSCKWRITKTVAWSSTNVVSDSPIVANELIHLCATCDNSGLIKLYVDGYEQVSTGTKFGVVNATSSVIRNSSTTNTTFYFRGLTADFCIHNRALSPAEIALLADRTDPMLGGLIVEERPVLYFDMGGSTTAEGPAIITAESVVALLGQKGAVGPATVTTSASVGMGGVKGASAPLNIAGTASVEAPGQKSTSGPATVSAQSSLGMGGIVELFGLDKTGPASFSAASSVGAGGDKASSSPAAIISASALGMGGIKTILGLDKEGPATFAASSSLGMGGAKGAISQAWIGADSEIVAAGVKAGIGSAAWLAAGGFMAGKGPDVLPITADEVARVVRAQSRVKTVAARSRVKAVRYAIS